MTDDSRQTELLLRWEEHYEQGRDITPEELCRDCPELMDDVRRAIAKLKRQEVFLNQGTTVHDGQEEGDATSGVPQAIGPYEIVREMGRGGMGVVYLARDPKLKRDVAVKMILSGAFAGSERLQMFQREAEAVARLQHPNIVQIHEIDEHDGSPFIILELVMGGSLADRLAKSTLPPQEAAAMTQTLALAIHAAHEQGIVHRDLKPANILLGSRGEGIGSREDRMSDDGEKLPKTKNRISAPYSLLPNPDSLIPKIADFGLAKQLEGQTESAAIAKGTPSYMAPEQETNKDISPRTDVYALGAILYEMLTGRPPFVGATAVEILRQVREQEPAPPRRLQANAPRDLETICLKCLNKAPEKRYASAQELALDLQRFQRGEPIVARPVSAIERSFRWMKRHPAYSGLIGVVGIASVLLLSSWAYFTIEIQKERDDAVTQKGIADVAKQKALAQKKIADDQKANAIAKQKLAEKRLKLVVNSIESLLIDTSQKALLDVANAEPVRRKLLERARRYYQNLLADEKDDPKLLYELAGTYFRVARMRQDDSATEARQLYQTTSRILEYLVDRYPLAQPKNPYIRFHIDLATTYENLAIQELNLGNFTDGVSYHQKALAKRQAIVKSESIKENDLVQVQNRLNMSYLNLGLAYEMRGRFKQSLVWIEKSKAAQQDLIRDHPNNFLLSRLRYNLGDVYLALARIHNRQGDLQQAVALGRKSCETADAVLDMNLRLANIPLSRVEELRTRAYLLTAEIVLGQEKVKTARAYLNQIESLCRNLAKKSGDNPYRDSLLAKWHLLDGEFKRQNNSLAEAETAFAKSQAIMESVVRREGLAQYFLELGNIDIQLGKTHEQQGNMAKAVQNYKTGMDRLQNGAKAYPNNAILQAEATKHCNWLAVKAKALANDEKISLAQELASHLSTSNKLSGEALFALACAFGKVSIVISKDQNRTEADRTTLCELAEALAAKLLLRAEKTGFLDQETQSAKTLFEAPELTRLLNRDDLKGLTNRLSTGR